MYVHIVDSWLKLIYTFWVFYVIILSICHKFIDSSIYGGLIPRNFLNCMQGNNHKGVGTRGTNAHWVNPYQFILSIWKTILSRESDQGNLSHIGLIPSYFFTGCKEIISREPAQGALRLIRLIPIKFFTAHRAIISRESSLGALRPIGLIYGN